MLRARRATSSPGRDRDVETKDSARRRRYRPRYMDTRAAHEDLVFAVARESELDALAELLAHAFGFPQVDAKPWFARAGLENVRTLKRGETICGGLLEIPMGQWFGGRSVRTMGVAGVGIAPSDRGRGAASHLMRSMLREARERGFALSTLYAATVSLYRRVGYERAGTRCAISFDPRTCEVARVPEMIVKEVIGTPEEVVALYGSVACRSPGYLDRGSYVWSRVVKPRGQTTKTFTVSHDGVLEGYVVLSHVMGNGESSVTVTDLAATTARAANAILRLLVEYRSIATSVTWFGGPSDIFTNLLPERHVNVRITDYFMNRIVDVVAALTQRGWRRSARGTIALELDDASLPENAGTYVVTLDGGDAKVEKGTASAGAARAKITERGLAALYSAHAQPHVLEAAGWLEAGEKAHALLEEWFGAPYPVTRDFF